jgi:hypothetical protein
VIEDLEESKNLKQELISGLRKSPVDDKKVTFADTKTEKKVNFLIKFFIKKTATEDRKLRRDFNQSEDFGYPKSLSSKKLNMNNSFSFQAVILIDNLLKL